MPLTRPTTTPLPDEIYDVWAPQLGEAELKVLLYIVRRTLGFRKSADAISLTQFLSGIVTRDGRVLDHGCGVKSRRSVVAALKSLEARGLIQAVKHRSGAGDCETSVYALWWEEDARAGSVPRTPPGCPGTPRWWPDDPEVVSSAHHGGIPGPPTTNSHPTNRQQDRQTTGNLPTARSQMVEDVGATAAPRHANGDTETLWQAVLAELHQVVTSENYDEWLAGTRVVGREGHVVRVAVPSPLHRRWLDARLRWHVERALSVIGCRDLTVTFEVTP